MEAPITTKTLIARAVLRSIEEAGTTLNAVAEATGIPQPTLHRQLVKGVGAVNVEHLGLIAEHLGITLVQLIALAEDAA